MEINISRKTLKKIALVIAVVICLSVGAVYLWYSGLLDTDLMNFLAGRKKAEHIMFDLPPEAPVSVALARLYAPDLNQTFEEWQDEVCKGMTENGCNLFLNMYAPAVWSTTQSQPVGADQVDFLEDIEILDDGRHVWKFKVTVFEGLEGEEYTEKSFTVFTEVVQSSPDKWLLDRILFDQEAQARYGGQEVELQ